MCFCVSVCLCVCVCMHAYTYAYVSVSACIYVQGQDCENQYVNALLTEGSASAQALEGEALSY
jgi:hypothetical protein